MIDKFKSGNCKLELSLFHNIVLELVSDDFDEELFKSLKDKKDFMMRRLDDLAKEIFTKDTFIKAAAISGFDLEIVLSNNEYIYINKITYKDMMFDYYSHNNIYKVHFFNNTHCISNYKPKYNYKYKIIPKNIVDKD